MEEDENNDVYRPLLQFEEEELPKLDETENSNIPQCEAIQDLDDFDSLMPSPPPLEPEVPEEQSEVVIEEEMADSSRAAGNSGRKRKRGRPPRSAQKKPPPKKEEEDLCFICFDGGNLVVCDRRGCPKVYHPTCVNRDEAFFRTRGRWNCGWHFCSICEKPAHHMCYTCTYSLCKGCIKEAEFFCIRGNKGFCETCMRTVMLIEKHEEANQDMAPVDFDDKNSWEYLFKDYWLDLKGKLSLTMEELNGANNPWKGSVVQVRSEASSGELYDANDNQDSSSENSFSNIEVGKLTRRKAKRKSRSSKSEEGSPVADEGSSAPKDIEWASKELLEFVQHMNDGDTSVLSQFDVQALLLEYIKRNNLRDPRRKSHILCDLRLQNLFGKERVGHFEMLKLLESHFLIKEVPSQGLGDDIQEGAGEGDHMEVEGDRDAIPKKRKGRKKAEEKPQTNLDDYAAINVHNINLIYLRRNLVEDLIEDLDNFQVKVTGSFVRIRISGTGQKQDMYRLVQVVGTGKAAEPYKTGKKTTDILLEILNLNKTENITIDVISNQEFSEEECNRLRQSIKCGLISRPTVGEIQEKARAFQAVKVNDFLETEIQRLSHLRDRASEKGRRKELRECVEKLQLLSTPEERSRRLEELPEVHADPKMDPSYESDDNDEDQDDKQQDFYSRSRDSGFVKRGREMVSPGTRKASNSTWEPSRKSGGWDKGDGASVGGSWDQGSLTNDKSSNRTNKPSWNQGRDRQGDANPSSTWDALKNQVGAAGSDSWKSQVGSNLVADWSVDPGKSLSNPTTGFMRPGPPTAGTETAPTPSLIINETEKMWHYQDPSGKIQGPFSMTQLRKWSTTGYFPADLKIWKTSEKQEDSILLTDALLGKFQKQPPTWESQQSSLSQVQRDGRLDNREGNREGNWGGNQNSTWTEGQQIGGAAWNSNWKDPNMPSNGIVESVKTDGWDSSRVANTWSGHPQGHSPSPGSTFSAKPFRAPSHQGREGGRGGGNGGRWNSVQNHVNTWNSPRPMTSNNWGSSGQSSGVGWRAQPENTASRDWSARPSVVIPTDGRGSDQMNRNDSMNLPTPTTPTPTGRGWMGGQSSHNKWSGPSSVPAQPTTPGSAPRHSWNQQASPMAPESGKVSAGWGEHASTNASAWGTDALISENNQTAQSFGSRPQPIKIHGENPQTFEPSSSSAAGSGSTGLAANAAANSRPNASWSVPNQSLTPGQTPSEKKDGWDMDPGSGDRTSHGSSPKPSGSSLDCVVGGAVPVQSLMMKDQVQSLGSENQGVVLSPAAESSQVNTKANRAPHVGSEEGGLGVPGPVLLVSPTTQKPEPSGSDPKPVFESHGWGQSSPQKLDTSEVGSAALKPVPIDSSSKPATDSQGWGSAVPAGSGTDPGISADGWKPISAQNPEVAANTDANQSNLPTSSLANQDPPSSSDPWKISPVEPSTPVSTGWGSGAQNTNTTWESKPGNAASTGWGTASQSWGPAVGSENSNTGWGSGPGNSNVGWGTQHRQDGERFSSQGEGGFHSGDSGHGGRPWNNNWQSGSGGGGGGGSGGPRGPRGPKVCKFHESGFCKKGASCNFLHP